MAAAAVGTSRKSKLILFDKSYGNVESLQNIVESVKSLCADGLIIAFNVVVFRTSIGSPNPLKFSQLIKLDNDCLLRIGPFSR